MKIQVGFEMVYECPKPTPMIFCGGRPRLRQIPPFSPVVAM